MSNKLELTEGQRWLSKPHAYTAHIFQNLGHKKVAVMLRYGYSREGKGEQGNGGEGERLSKQSIAGNTSHVSESVTFLNLANSKIEGLLWQCQILCICCQTYQSLKIRDEKNYK